MTQTLDELHSDKAFPVVLLDEGERELNLDHFDHKRLILGINWALSEGSLSDELDNIAHVVVISDALLRNAPKYLNLVLHILSCGPLLKETGQVCSHHRDRIQIDVLDELLCQEC